MPKPLKELLEAYTWHGSRQQNNLDTLVQSDEMARRLRALDELIGHEQLARFAYKAVYLRRILDGHMEEP